MTKALFIFIASFIGVSLSAQDDDSGTRKELKLTQTFIDAGKEKNLQNFEEAINLYQTCLQIDPEHDASYYELGQIYHTQKRYAEAQEMLEKAVDLSSDNKWYQQKLGNALDAQGKFKESSDVWEDLHERFPQDLEYVEKLGAAYVYSGKSKKAIKLYDEVEERMGVTEALSITKQKLYMNQGDIDEAAEEIEKLIDAYPGNPDHYGRLADIYVKAGKKDKAIETYERALKVDPENAFIQLSLAEFYDRQQQYEKSDDYLRKAFQNTGLDVDTKVTILLRLYRVAEQDNEIRNQALELCELLITAHPEEPKAASMYGDFLFLDEQWEEARKQYLRVIENDQSKYVIWNQLMILDTELEDPKMLEEHSDKAIELFPTQPVSYMFSGIANNQLGNYQKSADNLEMGLSLLVGSPGLQAQMLASLGDAYHELGNHQKSDSAYNLALSVDPENLYVLNNYAYFLALRNERLDDALKMSAQTVDREPNNASYLDTYGWILFQGGNYGKARKYLEQSLENGGGSSGEVLEHLGDTLFKLNKVEDAVEYWKKALEKGGASEDIEQKIEQKSILP